MRRGEEAAKREIEAKQDGAEVWRRKEGEEKKEEAGKGNIEGFDVIGKSEGKKIR